ncbi:hypothetical protein E4T56_gene3230 [Termitomyces sp. T112]|nr:hypothetical protein E4T56_gene3230 [Termitomyces sp. T112]KAH0590781.1 hypothetical protein H2248_000906 [Termitomyces sp. 'cryptogamus']KNZ77427.1 hypothetical protein J132_05443 [Termitomyces sp. J132]
MSENPLLPNLRRIVTGHDQQGNSVVDSDRVLLSEPMGTVKGARSAAIWVTTDSIPTNDNNNLEDGAARTIDDQANFRLVHPNGTNLRSTELAPGSTTVMHRTSSLDYNILVQGELILITEDGTEKHLKNPGDTVIQKGTMHAWKNPTDKWTRWVSVLIAAEPAIFNGETLGPAILPVSLP